MINKDVNKGKANLNEMEELHGLITQNFKELLQSGTQLTAGDLNAAANWVKANNVFVDVVKQDKLQDMMAEIGNLEYDIDVDALSLDELKKLK